jgi:serine protease AprX
VIAAIDWVVQHRTDNGMNIRVLNLSYGTNSTHAYEVDPLAFAVEQAWKAGIVVVAAGGNSGYQKGASAPGLANPAYDPYVIAVGASDSMYTPAIWDDTIATFSASRAACNNACRNPDLVAPGAHIQGLRVPGSYIDQSHPEGILDGRYFRGSGTSQSAAIVSGAVALLLQKHPATPPTRRSRSCSRGVHRAATAPPAGQRRSPRLDAHAQPGQIRPELPGIDRDGIARAVRGTDHLTRDGVVSPGTGHLRMAFDAPAMAALEAAGSSWSGGVWNGSSWSGSSWSGSSWSGSSWSGSAGRLAWSGSSWSGAAGRVHPGPAAAGRVHLVRQQLVGQLMVRQQLVGQRLVDRRLG